MVEVLICKQQQERSNTVQHEGAEQLPERDVGSILILALIFYLLQVYFLEMKKNLKQQKIRTAMSRTAGVNQRWRSASGCQRRVSAENYFI